ncbi:MAG: Uma2 family endonuclease [Acidimicrobiia bacterium]|nr:Uma2 family endonuclease [bacterium]MXZ30491.1 Uma2 family endonuclease [Acidimicrobiia bacterium]MYB24074.1 Uma2 family endonuclease [Acidimicrobiia bacterium]MYE67771.1 Uma2 family endonuclease [Acidimicrobiia bacterium]
MDVLLEVDPAVAYPATAPEMGESPRHVRAQFHAYGALSAHFAHRPDCYVGQELNVYYRPMPRTAFVVPDVMVCFGVDAGAIEQDVSYRIWDVGAPPALVLEIASGTTHGRDTDDKPAIYLEVGADEYWRFDPSGLGFYEPRLQGDRRAGDTWKPIEVVPDGDGRLVGRSGVLGLDVYAETHRLRFRDYRTGRWLSDPDDTRRERDAAEARATAAEARAKTAEAELAALRARLNDQT